MRLFPLDRTDLMLQSIRMHACVFKCVCVCVLVRACVCLFSTGMMCVHECKYYICVGLARTVNAHHI